MSRVAASLNAACEALFSTRKGLVVLYLVFLAAYLGASGSRLRRPSPYNHFTYLAEGWLDGRLALKGPPPNENDWAKVEVLTLRDGRVVKGMFGTNGRFFRASGGPSESIPEADITRRESIRYVSFPPFPAVAMLPVVAFAKLRTNDVIFNAVWAAANPVLLFLLLRFLRRKGYSERSISDDLWLTALLGAGSVYFYASVIGQVWYTAHVIAVTFSILFIRCALEAARPWLAGLCLGLGFATRVPLAFMFPFFVAEAVRTSGGWRRLWQEKRPSAELVRKLVAFAIPAAVVVAILLWHNHARFGRITEFGHKYLNITWQDRMQRWGEMNYHFLSRNLACALVLLPRILVRYPFVQVSVHGMSIFLTSPTLAWLGGPKRRSPIAPALAITALAMALPGLLYHNSGYVQWGYRFSIDYMPFLVALLAIGGRPLTRLFKVLLVLSIGVNLLGAITFDRFPEFTYDDSFFPHGNH
jgi:hypothetical protein